MFKIHLDKFKKGNFQLLAKVVHLALINCLRGLGLPGIVVRSTDHPNMTIAVYHGHKETQQHLLLYKFQDNPFITIGVY